MVDLIFAATVSLAVCLLTGPILISWFRRLKFGQNIREAGPQGHFQKAGTPTMGGIIILLSTAIATLVFSDLNEEIKLALFVMGGYGLLGLLDDGINIMTNKNEGLNPKQKMAGQIIIAAIFAFYALIKLDIGTEILVPYFGMTINLGLLFVPFVIFVVVGTSNAVNLTDGLDGLAAGVTIIVMITYSYISYQFGNLNLAIFAVSIAGACLGFSWFNSYPAQVFMGDTGSLALGGALAVISVLTKTEFFLLIIGGVYVIEAVSVIMQVSYFKLTGGKRIFKMTPIHHHFEQIGWKESKIVVRFWIVAIILSLVGLLEISKF